MDLVSSASRFVSVNLNETQLLSQGSLISLWSKRAFPEV